MSEFYVFGENGVMMFTTTDEDYASAWCDVNNGYYCCDESDELNDGQDLSLTDNYRFA